MNGDEIEVRCYTNPGRPSRYSVRARDGRDGKPQPREEWIFRPRTLHGDNPPSYHDRDDASTHLYRTGLHEKTVYQMLAMADANPGVPVVYRDYVVSCGETAVEAAL